MRTGLAALAVLATACGREINPAVLAVDVTGCQPARYGSVVGSSLRADAPVLAGGRRYRCLVFPGTAEHRVQLTVFADGFDPVVYLLEPGESPHRLLARSATSTASGVARTSIVLPRTRPYAAVVTAAGREGGTFLLSVQDQP